MILLATCSLSCCTLAQILDGLVDDQVIPVDRADQAKARFAKLHSALFEAMSREKDLLDNAKQLKRKLDVRAGRQAGLRDSKMQAEQRMSCMQDQGQRLQASSAVHDMSSNTRVRHSTHAAYHTGHSNAAHRRTSEL
jgi:hypothetical protein